VNNNKGIKIASLFMAMLVVSMFAVAPAMACVPQQNVDAENLGGTTCSTCGSGSYSNITRLNSEELANNLHVVLNSANVKKLTKELNSKGYKLNLIDSRGVGLTRSDGTFVEGVVLPFISEDNSDVGILAEVNMHKVSKVVAVLINKNDELVPTFVERLTIENNIISTEKMDVPLNNVSSLSEVTTLSYTKCDACQDLYNVACAVGCGLDVALICLIAGVSTVVGGLACTAIAATVCYFIGKYGCDPEAEYFCTQYTSYC
jgi:halocin C8-like bacteriocin domain-containing protein